MTCVHVYRRLSPRYSSAMHAPLIAQIRTSSVRVHGAPVHFDCPHDESLARPVTCVQVPCPRFVWLLLRTALSVGCTRVRSVFVDAAGLVADDVVGVAAVVVLPL